MDEQETNENNSSSVENNTTHDLVQNEDAITRIEETARAIINNRNRPLLVMYYPGEYGRMVEEDVEYCYRAFRDRGITLENPLAECDALIHTYGGSPLSAYALGQIVRDLSGHVICLVPEHAYSAGTLFCFCGNQIRLGHYAGLSPIDITQEEVELASIDYYRNFARDCQLNIQKVIQSSGQTNLSSVGSDLLCMLVDQVGALKVGEFYRARTLAGHYAQELLDKYMLKNTANAIGRRNKIIREFLFEAPAHQFHVDYHLCSNIGLIVDEMPTIESDLTKKLIDLLNDLTGAESICPNITDDYKMPFFALYI